MKCKHCGEDGIIICDNCGYSFGIDEPVWCVDTDDKRYHFHEGCPSDIVARKVIE